MTFRIQVAGEKDFGDLARDLRRAGKGLRPRLTAELRRPTKDTHDRVRAAILGADLSARRAGGRPFTRHIASQGVRRPTAAALRWKVSSSSAGPTAEITFSGSKIPARIQALFPYWVGQKRRLRHPIMGHDGGRWVTQKVPNVWDQTKRLAPAAQEAAGRALDDTAKIISGRARRADPTVR